VPFEQTTGRCGSCGRPTADNDLCQSCRDAFSSVLGSQAAETSAQATFDFAAAEPAVVESDAPAVLEQSQTVQSLAPVAAVAFGPPVAPAPSDLPVVADLPVLPDVPVRPVVAVAVDAPARRRAIRPELAAVAVVVVVAVVGIPVGARWLRQQIATKSAPVEVTAPVVKRAPVVREPTAAAGCGGAVGSRTTGARFTTGAVTSTGALFVAIC